MSLMTQEQAMLALLFDVPLRQRFMQDRATALQPFGLDQAELADFQTIRLDALEFDANLRRAILLAAIAKTLPLTFAALSACPGGIDRLRNMLDLALVTAAPAERPVQFALRLREQLAQWSFPSAREQSLVQAILEAELGMAWTARSRRQAALAGSVAEPACTPLPTDWQQLPLQMASDVSAAVLPQSWQRLKQAWCPGPGSQLWRDLQKTPLSLAARQAMLDQIEPRLLLARAVVAVPSVCDPVIEHHTTEMPEGFAALFQYVDGQHSVANIVAGLQQAGAQDAMLKGVEAGFRQLLESGMLVPG